MDKEKKMEEHIVSFIDILGSKEAIKADAENSLKIMYDSYTEAIKLFEFLFEDKKMKPKVKIFSDNIVVAVPHIGESGHGAFCAIVMLSAIIQVQFLKHGLLTRGGIAAGSFFADELMVWGKGLVNAYAIENSIAIYPRVIIDPDLIAELKLAQDDCVSKSKEWIVQDIDGMFSVDYINKYLGNRELFSIIILEMIEQKILLYIKDAKVCQKWLWLNNYITTKIDFIAEEK